MFKSKGNFWEITERMQTKKKKIKREPEFQRVNNNLV